jgi:hypothetical protein
MPYFGVPIRNGLPIGLGSQAGFGIAPFDPRDLFSAGEQGAWYDPSDFSTLFTDSVGTTPVTGVEQFVGLMLDKSKGAPTTLGAELWSGFGTINSPWTNAGGGVFTIDGSQVASRDLSQTPQYTIGKFYVTQFTLSGVTGGTVQVFAGEGTVGPSLGNGTYTYRQSASQAYLIFRAPAGVAATVSKVSVRELPGNHVTSTGTKRPKLAARYNLLTYSEQFDNAVWALDNGGATNPVVTANAGLAPNGTQTADRIVFNKTGGTFSRIQQSVLSAIGLNYTFSVWMKTFSGGTSNVGLRVELTGINCVVTGDWQRFTVSTTATATSIGGQILLFDSIPGNDETADVLVWGADLRPTSQATGLIGPTYQRVAAATDYDTVGFLPYLAFDGVDDSMSTGSIDFTATDKMTVFAGVRKLSDAAPILAELSANFNSNAGSFFFSPSYDGVSAAANLAFTSRGNAAAAIGQIAISAGFASPVTLITTATGNIAGDLSALRINGAASGTNGTADQGAGNYGNYPLFIGARNNASLYFQGWLSSLIIRGAQSTDSQISATESWVAGKTGVQLTTQSTISVQNSGGTAYSVLLTVLNSSGNSYTVTNTVLSSNGTSYTV